MFDLAISEGALDATFRRAMPRFDAEIAPFWRGYGVPAVVCCDETSVRVEGKTCWDWVFQNGEVVIHVIRHSRGARVVGEVMDGHRPAIWVSDLYGAQRDTPPVGRFASRINCAIARSPSRREMRSSHHA